MSEHVSEEKTAENEPEIIEEAQQSQHVSEEPETGFQQAADKKKKHRKVKQLLGRPFAKLNRLKEKKVLSEAAPPPCPHALDEYYDGAEFAPSGCFVCCFNPSSPGLPLDGGVHAEQKKPYSSYGAFLRGLIEKNDFYSNDCNVHKVINSSDDEA